ncbi:NAD-dependent epimerase [Virgibacillus profundi]|uniref:NAD-dependent epimerase n=1 Tax=Virgibacillus profundi TaxID=2024555 RepID=A0A2A2IJ22_9BACI|nr:NAD-dependent epimerase/dehydratase family protein [Virgibacillus profundi]PAV31095.1 NAD-dependent epimerase [Virgibacillus profundi]PXY55278.1 NAD-dependent epimerase [Virgibacillus profundi]
MKRVLITGVNSYVGNNLASWLEKSPEQYAVDCISLRNDAWREMNFSVYDSIVHVAGIAHVSKDPKMEEKYYKINRDLTIEIAKKSKKDSVKQFIFMSSIIVYGDAAGEKGIIDQNTIPQPRDFYGNSKLQAEKGITPLGDDTFKVAVIRPPMIYGKASKGNYPKLAKAAQKLPMFPDFDNKRSMLHIDNLSEFILLMIENEESGLFFPQNSEYVKTSEMVKLIAQVDGGNIKLVKVFNPILRFMSNKVGIVNKVFGNLVYDKAMSEYDKNYRINDLKSSIELTESREH